MPPMFAGYNCLNCLKLIVCCTDPVLTGQPWSRQTLAFLVGFTMAVSAWALFAVQVLPNVDCTSPGCNIPPSIWVDHYSIEVKDGQPTLLTVWFGNSWHGHPSIALTESYLEDNSVKHVFPLSGVTLPANSVSPISIDTTASNFQFAHNRCYGLELVAEEGIYGFGDLICYV